MSVIFSDSGCDVLPEFVEKYGIKLISYPFVLDDKEFSSNDIDLKEFYTELRNGKVIKTASLNPIAYEELFEEYLKQNEDIIYIHFSSQLSGTFNHIPTAIEELKKKYPSRKIDIINTNNISAASGILAIEVAKRNKDGMPHNELVLWANQNKNQFSTYFFVDDLKFLKRGGRISSTTAIIGTMLKIKPLLTCASDGKLKVLGKAIGHKKALNELVSFTKKYGKDITNHPFFILHAGDPECAEELKTMLLTALGPSLKIHIGIVGTTVGSHCGPGTVAVFFHGPQLIID